MKPIVIPKNEPVRMVFELGGIGAILIAILYLDAAIYSFILFLIPEPHNSSKVHVALPLCVVAHQSVGS